MRRIRFAAAACRRALSASGIAAWIVVGLVVLGALALAVLPWPWRNPHGARTADDDKRRDVNCAHEWRDAEALGYGTQASASAYC